MCEFCEPLTSERNDLHKYRKLLQTNYSSVDFGKECVETMACIIPPTPISKRKHSEDGLVSEMEIYISDDHRKNHHLRIPIKYCPICGKEIK